MHLRSILRIVVLFASLTFFAVPVAHAQMRAAPKGDDFADAVNVPLNSTKTIKNAELATEQSDVDDPSSCDLGGNSANSVWFKFTLDADATLDLYPGSGTLLVTDSFTFRTPVTSVFHNDFALTEEICTTSNSLTGHFYTAGEYRVRLAANVGQPLLDGSRYRLSIRNRSFSQLLENGDFDNTFAGNWKIRNAGTPPKVLQNCPTSDCTLRFDGVAKGKISQSITIDSSRINLVIGDLMSLFVAVNATPASGSDIKLTLKITYSDGTPTAEVKRIEHATRVQVDLVYVIPNAAILDVESKSISSIKVTISSPNVTDTFTLGRVSVQLASGSYRSAEGILPLSGLCGACWP